MRSFFFRNDGIILDRSVCSRERTIVPKERRPALPLIELRAFVLKGIDLLKKTLHIQC